MSSKATTVAQYLAELPPDRRAEIEHVREAVRLDPTNVEAHTNLAAAHAVLGEFHRAVDIIEGALKLNLSDPVAAVLRARLEAYRRSSRARLR